MFLTITFFLLLTLSIYFYLTIRSRYIVLKNKDEEVEKIYNPASIAEKKLQEITDKYTSLQSQYQSNLLKLRNNKKRLSQYYLSVGTTDSIAYSSLSGDDNLEDIKEKLETIKNRIKQLVSEKKACVCNMGNDVTVNGKKSEARKLFNREIKLRLRCLDNEFKAAMALADWNNINRLIQRAKETFNDINSSGGIVKTYLKKQYLKLKIEELQLDYEYNHLKQEIKEAEREEARIQREAEREEARIKAAAEKVKKERKMMEKLVAEELLKLESSTKEQKALYELHKKELEVLKEKEKRAVSLAQLTRAGFVYVISNKTSFGEGVCKIGMTRRVDPNERVKELGDASVPELFDIHAFAFTDDAPKLEKYLHNKFTGQRVNLVNNRKEFFNVSPDDVISELSNFDGEYELIGIEQQ